MFFRRIALEATAPSLAILLVERFQKLMCKSFTKRGGGPKVRWA